VELDRCTHQDFLDILIDLEDFWGTDRARQVHHPMFVHEFGDTAWVVRSENRIIAYLFAFWSQSEPAGYIHLVAVRRSHQRRGIGRMLYEQFEARARERGCTKLKALTPPINTDSIAFHRSLGFTPLGEPNDEGVPVVQDYFGPGMPRVVFEKRLA
jgi:GNAT superfamily N-acetyltransferase